MSVKRRQHGHVAILDVGGEFYGDHATDELEQALKDEVARGTRHLILNLYACRMMNSTTLGVMLGAKKALDAIGSKVRLCGLGSRRKSVLVATRLMEWFEVSDSEIEALAALSQGETVT